MSALSLKLLAVGVFFLLTQSSVLPPRSAQKTDNPNQFPEMLAVEGGFLAIDTPKDWVRAEGPGMAFFLRKGSTKATADVWIYISGFDLEPGDSTGSLQGLVRSDIQDFKKRFKNGTALEERPFELPKVRAQAAVVTFRSGEEHNGFEQVMYIRESDRVLTLVLSAKTEQAFSKSLPVFQQFAKSYGGMIVTASTQH